MPGRIRFYLDEHVPSAEASGLRQRGVDVLTAGAAGMLGASDRDHVGLALRTDRVIFTQDADFLRLHAASIPHSGIAFAPQLTPVGTIVRGLMLLYQVLDAEDMPNHVEFL